MDPRTRGDELAAAFAGWAADQRISDAVASRALESSLREQASSSATWTGVMVDLAEQAAVVAVDVGATRRSGRLVAVGSDFCVLDQDRRPPAVIASRWISAIWADQLYSPGGDRAPNLDMTLAAALSVLAEDRSPVRLDAHAAQEVLGELLAVGEDLLIVRTDPPARKTVHVPLHALMCCELR